MPGRARNPYIPIPEYQPWEPESGMDPALEAEIATPPWLRERRRSGGGLGSLLLGGGGAAGLGSMLGGGGVPAAPEIISATPILSGGSAAGAAGAAPAAAATPLTIAGAPLLPVAAVAAGGYLADRALSGVLGDQKNKPLGLMARGFATGGISPLFEGAKSLLGKKPRTEVEDKRWDELKKKGVQGYGGEFRKTKDKNAWYRKDLAADFVGKDDKGEWVNNKFSKSRNVNDLKGEDVWGYSLWGEKLGDRWMGTSEQNRKEIADEALRRGALSEGRGTIDATKKWDSDFDKFVEDKLSGKSPSKQQSTRPLLPSSGNKIPTASKLPLITKDPELKDPPMQPKKPLPQNSPLVQALINRGGANSNKIPRWKR